MFSKNTRAAVKHVVMQTLGLQQETTNGKYLGLPMYVGRSVTQCLEYIKDRLWKRILGWIQSRPQLLVLSVYEESSVYVMWGAWISSISRRKEVVLQRL